MTRQAYLLQKHNLIVFWTPKAACTSIVEVICKDILSEKNIRGSKRTWLRENGFYIDGTQAQKLIERENYQNIALIRDPYDRLVSAYLNKFVLYHGKYLENFDQLEGFAKNFYSIFNRRNMESPLSGASQYRGLSFREFVDEICFVIGQRAGKEPNLNHHWNTQVPFYFIETNFEYGEVYELKDSESFFKRLGELCGKSISPVKANSTKFQENSSQDDLTSVSSLQLARTHSVVTKTNLFSDELSEKIRTAFYPDYFYISKSK